MTIHHSTIVNSELVPNDFEGFVENSIVSGSGSGSRATITNSIISTNFGLTCKVDSDKLSLNGINFSTDGNCGTKSGDINLGILTDNGCFVTQATPSGQSCIETHALLDNSVALDAATNSTFKRDQRDFPRPSGVADVGAFEVGNFAPSDPGRAIFLIPLTDQKSVIINL